MEIIQVYPVYILILDYCLGVVMWTLIGRAVLDVFIAPDSNMVIARVFRQVTNPVIRFFKRITPSFLIPILVPLYVAWWFYLVRFYLIPLIFVGELGMLSFSLESYIGSLLR